MPRQTAAQRRRATGETTKPTARPATLEAVRMKARVRTHLNPEVEQALVDALKGLNTLANACRLVGIGESTLYSWLKRADGVQAKIDDDPDRTDLTDDDFRYLRLRERLTRARADAQDVAVDATRRQIVGGQLISREPALNADGLPIYDGGKLTYREQWTVPDGRLALQFLSLSFPQEWGKNVTQRFEVVNASGSTEDPDGRVDPSAGIQGDMVSALAARMQQMRAAREARELEAVRPQGGDSPVDGDDVTDAEIVEDGDDQQ